MPPAAMDLMPNHNKRRHYESLPMEWSRDYRPPYWFRSRSPPKAQHPLNDRPPIRPRDQGDAELRQIVKGHHLPHTAFFHLEETFISIKDESALLKDEIRRLHGDPDGFVARGQKIQEHEARFRKMKEEIQDRDWRIKKLGRGNDRLHGEVKKQENQLRVQEELMRASAKGMEQKRLEKERLEKEKTALQTLLEARDATIASQDVLIVQMRNASGDVMTEFALEAQAQRTLGMVQGLHADIAERDGVITGLTQEVTRWKGKMAEQERQSVEQEKALQESEAAANAARQRAAEAQRISEDQGKFIELLMETNASLQLSHPA